MYCLLRGSQVECSSGEGQWSAQCAGVAWSLPMRSGYSLAYCAAVLHVAHAGSVLWPVAVPRAVLLWMLPVSCGGFLPGTVPPSGGLLLGAAFSTTSPRRRHRHVLRRPRARLPDGQSATDLAPAHPVLRGAAALHAVRVTLGLRGWHQATAEGAAASPRHGVLPEAVVQQASQTMTVSCSWPGSPTGTVL